ncbi:LysR substrate-binding domain-containing protein [Pseudomonas sp. QLc11A]|jgi:LysR family glycine cleavage system transcriptional activator|uniref:LysR substrate-binding domain-containing protein n=1 Tax=Pseudomonas azerbaijanorientalis TaxID=2842350 RepID=A0ABW8W6T7_9PSED
MALPPLHSFRVFECVARLGNIAAAAVELHVTTGAISQQLRVLQSGLGKELFEKKGRRLVLTDNGRLLQHRVANAICEIQDGVRQLSSKHPGERQKIELTLSIPSVHGVTWLATRLFAFMDENPHIKLNVITASYFNTVDWRRADLAVIYGVPPWPGFWWRLVHGIRMTPVCSPQLLRGPKAIRSVSDLAHYRLLHEDDGAQWRRWLSEARFGLSSDSDIYFDDFGMVLQAARDGYGVALSDEVVSARDLDEGRLVQPLALAVPALQNYYCVCSEGNRDREEVSNFIEWLIAQSRPPVTPQA